MVDRSKKTLKAAIIGCGNIAGGYDERGPADNIMTHARAYTLHKHIDLVAVYDPNQEAMRQFAKAWKVAQTFSDLKEMLENIRPDIVSICSPNETHFSILKTVAAYKPAAIICEKPLSLSVDESRSMLQIARDSSIQLAVNYMRRWDPTLNDLGKKIQSNSFGSLQNARVYYSKGVFHNASHAINLLKSWLGELNIEQVWNYKKNGKEDFTASFVLSSASCKDIVFQSCDADNFGIYEIEFLFSKARVCLLGGGNQVAIYETMDSSLVPGTKVLNSTPKLIAGSLHRVLGDVVGNVWDAVVNGAPLKMPAEDALETIILSEKIKQKGLQHG